jgi:hypothetical protein
VFDFGFEWTHHAVLIVDKNQDETGRSSCKVYTDWHKKGLGEDHLYNVNLGWTFDGATKMRSNEKSPLGPALYSEALPAREMLLVKSSVLGGNSMGGRLQRLAVMTQQMGGLVSGGYPTDGFDDKDDLPLEVPNRNQLWWMFHCLLHALNLMMDKIMKYHARPCAMRCLAAMCTYVRKSSKRLADLQRAAAALTDAQKAIRDRVARNMQGLRSGKDSDSDESDDKIYYCNTFYYLSNTL